MFDILILSNGPGEVATWVRPVVAALRQRFAADQARISVVLSPDSNAGGREAEMAQVRRLGRRACGAALAGPRQFFRGGRRGLADGYRDQQGQRQADL